MFVYLINRYIWNDLQLGKLNVNCLLLKLNRKLRKMFLSPTRESNAQSSGCILAAIWVLVAQWLERLTEGQKISGSILMFMGLRNIFLSLRLSLSSKQFTFVSQCVTRCIMAGATCLTMALQDKLHKKSHRITRHLMTTKQFIFHPHCHENQHFICIIRLVKTGRISHRYEWFVLTTFLSRTYLYIGLI